MANQCNPYDEKNIFVLKCVEFHPLLFEGDLGSTSLNCPVMSHTHYHFLLMPSSPYRQPSVLLS
jgi:hypothetical protein